jgi:multimeric flavodoxin WrbA
MTTEMSSLLQKLKDNKGAKFASLVYTNNHGETSRYTILIGFSYQNAVEKSLATLSEQAEKMLSNSIEYMAASELIQSFQKNLNGEDTGYTKADIYADTDIQGVKRNTNDNSLKLFGLIVDKKVISEGEPRKAVKSSEKTIAKNKLSRELPVGKFREFKLSPDALARMALNGETVVFE